MIIRGILLLVAALALLGGCGSSDPAAFSADQPNAIVAAIESAVAAAGNGMVTSTRRETALPASPFETFRIAPTVCDEHGYPDGLSYSSNHYPGYLSYCFMTVNSGDTVRGGFATAKELSCALQNAGVVYDGASHTVTVSGAGCFSGLDAPTTMSVTYVATAPAAFNTNYAKGVVLDIDMGTSRRREGRDASHLTFKIASNVSGANISFITHELWNDDSTGAHSGTYDSTAHRVWYEAREERIACTVTSGRCGWNRHTRMVANVTLTGTTLSGLTDISFAYANIQSPPGQSGYGGVLTTSSGAVATGIKSRLWQATDGSSGAPTGMSDYQSAPKWVEVANTACYTSTSETATTCGTGLANFSTNAKFALAGDQQALNTWFAGRSPQSFTAVDMDLDLQ